MATLHPHSTGNSTSAAGKWALRQNAALESLPLPASFEETSHYSVSLSTATAKCLLEELHSLLGPILGPKEI